MSNIKAGSNGKVYPQAFIRLPKSLVELIGWKKFDSLVILVGRGKESKIPKAIQVFNLRLVEEEKTNTKSVSQEQTPPEVAVADEKKEESKEETEKEEIVVVQRETPLTDETENQKVPTETLDLPTESELGVEVPAEEVELGLEEKPTEGGEETEQKT